MKKTIQTIKAYDQNMDKYVNKFMDFQQYKEKINEFSKDINFNSRVLDLGCGPGNVMNYLKLANKKLELVGIDLSEEMIKVAKENIKEGKFYCQDIRDIKIEEKEFDVIIMSFCIVHLFEEETKEVLKKVSKFLKEKGKFYISFMEGKESGYESTSFSEEKMYFNYYSDKMIEKELKKVGIIPYKKYKQDYKELDGSITSDIFIFGEKI